MIDILYNILLQSDLQTINNLYQINKDTIIICKSVQFWKDKFVNDKLPIFKAKDETLSQYKLYAETVKSIKRATDTLIINRIEATRNHNKTTGRITLVTSCNYTKFTDILLPNILIDNIKNQFNDPNIGMKKPLMDRGFFIDFMIIKYIDTNSYKLICAITDEEPGDMYRVYLAKIIINNDQVKNMLTKFIFDIYTGYDNMECVDDHYTPFIFEDIDYHDQNSLIYTIRRGIWESLNYI